MLILLPPSETKRDGGEGAPLSEVMDALSFPELSGIRKKVIAATVTLAKKPAECAAALKLSPKQMGEVERNKNLRVSPTMPAIDRYTGVLFDGLAAINLPEPSRDFLGASVFIQSALLGPLGALDHIPAYRLSFDSKLPSLAAGNLKKAWADKGAIALNKRAGDELVLDLRSEGYAALSPLIPGKNRVYLRVVTQGEGGQLRALNHFNKKGKGEFVRALAQDSQATSSLSSVDELIAWGKTRKLVLQRGNLATSDWPEELLLVVSGTLQKLC